MWGEAPFGKCERTRKRCTDFSALEKPALAEWLGRGHSLFICGVDFAVMDYYKLTPFLYCHKEWEPIYQQPTGFEIPPSF